MASAGLHLLLLLVIFIGPAFVSHNGTEIREINFILSIVVPDNVAGGGNPNARPPAVVVPPVMAPPRPPAQPPSQPRSEVKPEPKPEPARAEVAKTAPPDPDDFSERKKKPEIITTPQIRRRTNTRTSETAREAENEARKAADARRTLAREIASAAAGIREGSASATAVDEDFGPGGGGPAYAGYDSLVQMVYQNAWVKPDDTSKDTPVAYATVTIARDGTVVPGSARIITRSGDSQMDSSVQRTLDRVSTIGRPFPEAMKEKQRTYKLRFDLTKRSLT
ncbi:MAG TPA: TonB C-terminal domain-containing protein [Verrucomicrobiae bacterium]